MTLWDGPDARVAGTGWEPPKWTTMPQRPADLRTADEMLALVAFPGPGE